MQQLFSRILDSIAAWLDRLLGGPELVPVPVPIPVRNPRRK
ncbi:MAG TPA: hypothetical protein VGD69_06740 [Herpetosiphonaceae bacterium]